MAPQRACWFCSDKEPVCGDVFHEPRALLPEAEAMGAGEQGLQAGPRDGGSADEGPLLPRPGLAADGTLR